MDTSNGNKNKSTSNYLADLSFENEVGDAFDNEPIAYKSFVSENNDEMGPKSNNGMVNLSFENGTSYVDEVECKSPVSEKNEESQSQNAKTKFNWTQYGEWDDLDSVLDFLEDEGYVCYDDKDLVIGQKLYFRCKKTPKAVKPYCAKRFILFMPSNNNDIILMHNGLEHNHTELMAGKKQQMSDEMLKFINNLFEKNVIRYETIIEFIKEAREEGQFQDEPDPRPRQIEYRLKCFRNEDVPPLFHLGDLNDWCEKHSSFPSDVNETFVIGHQCAPSTQKQLNFQFVLSTPALLEKMVGLKQICIDATYKLNWNDFPLIILGSVDRANKFHPLVYACTSNETTEDYKFVFDSVKSAIEAYYGENFQPTTIIADGAHSIRNAFFSVFESAKIGIMCFPHVLRNVMKQKFTVKTNKWLIIADIKKIQQSSNREMFEMMSDLFCKKWKNFEPEFISYFKKQWLNSLCNWFEGCANYTPSTNNGVESHNANIKRKITLRKRLPLNQFLVAMKTLTGTCSTQFTSGKRFIETDPKIVREVMVDAAFMVQNKFKCFKVKSLEKNMIVYVVPSQTNCAPADATEEHYKDLVKRQWKSLDEYLTHGFQKFYLVKVSSQSWKNKSLCSCVYFFKKNCCKHIIAVGMREKMIDMPDAANPTLLNQKKRNRGRTFHAKGALQYQN